MAEERRPCAKCKYFSIYVCVKHHFTVSPAETCAEWKDKKNDEEQKHTER